MSKIANQMGVAVAKEQWGSSQPLPKPASKGPQTQTLYMQL